MFLIIFYSYHYQVMCVVWSAGQPAVSRDAQRQATTALSDALKHSQHALAATAAAALGHAGLRGALPLPQPDPASTSSSAHDNQSSGVTPPGADRPKSPERSTATAANQSTSTAGNAAVETPARSTSEAAASDTAVASDQSVMQKIMALTKDKDVKGVQKAATAAGHICAGHAVKGNLGPALEGLLALGFNKNEDVLFTVGEALCFAFGGEPAVSTVLLMIVTIIVMAKNKKCSCSCCGGSDSLKESVWWQQLA